MRKRLSILLLFLLVWTLCACGSAPPPAVRESVAAETPAQLSPVGETEVPSSPTDDPAMQEELSLLLGELRQNVSIAAAGSSLRAASMAARLLDWAETADISDEQILAALEPWLGDLDDGVPAEFREQLAAVWSAAAILTGDDPAQAEALLSDAGCENSAYPWNDGAVSTLRRILDLAGLGET